MKIVDFYDNLFEGGDLARAGKDISTPQITGEELKRQLEMGPLNAYAQIIFRPKGEIAIGRARFIVDPKTLGKDDNSFGEPKSD